MQESLFLKFNEAQLPHAVQYQKRNAIRARQREISATAHRILCKMGSTLNIRLLFRFAPNIQIVLQKNYKWFGLRAAYVLHSAYHAVGEGKMNGWDTCKHQGCH